MSPRHLLEIDDLTPAEVAEVLALAEEATPPHVLAGKGVALLFEKQSARTRNSTEMAVVQLGGHPVTIRPDEVSLDVRESTEDVTRTLAGYHAAICARVYDHHKLERMVAVSTVPIVNMLSDQAHPLQALADLLTIRAELGSFEGRTVAYVGDSNNVTRSLALAAGSVGMAMRVASPTGYQFGDEDVDRIRARCPDLTLGDDPVAAVSGADVVYTDTWISMGQEAESDRRRLDFAGFTVDDDLLGHAGPDAILLHCLPAHRGEEVSASALEGERSRIWVQAENRMHSARGLLAWIVGRSEAGAG